MRSHAASSLVAKIRYVTWYHFLPRDGKETSQHEQRIKYVLYHEDNSIRTTYCKNVDLLLRFLILLISSICHRLIVFSAVQAEDIRWFPALFSRQYMQP